MSEPALPKSGSIYQHYKGGLYRVIRGVMMEATGSPGVRYVSLDPQASAWEWARELRDFMATVEVDGEPMPRFTLVPMPDPEALYRALPPEVVPREQLERLLAYYDMPHRFYHARWHLHAMFETAERHGLQLTPEQAVAILFHDIVYVAGAQARVNEALSVLMLRHHAAALSRVNLEAVAAIIEDTADHEPRSEASAVVQDLDLALLAADAALFNAANEMVRLEYRSLMPNPESRLDFFRERVGFLKGLAERGPLFRGPLTTLEASARENIERLRRQWLNRVRRGDL